MHDAKKNCLHCREKKGEKKKKEEEKDIQFQTREIGNL